MTTRQINYPIDALAWLTYLLGFGVALADYGLLGVLLCTIALLFLLSWYYSIGSGKDILNLSFKRWRVIALLATTAFFILFVLGFRGIAFLCMGLIMYTYACVCLKEGVVYYGGQFRFEDNTRAERSVSPSAYWFWIILFSLGGTAILVLVPVAKRW